MKFVLCIQNKNYSSSLEVRKIYVLIPDKQVESKGLLRIIDESGEDYLYPANYFIPLDLPSGAQGVFQEMTK